MSAPAVAVTSDGTQFAAAWKDVREGAPRVWFGTGPRPHFGADRPIAGEAHVGHIARNHPSIAVSSSGVFWLAWEEGEGAATVIRGRSSADPETVIDIAGASDGTPGYPTIACGAGLVVVAWETSRGAAGDAAFLRVLRDR